MGIYDGSVKGISARAGGNIRTLKHDSKIRLSRGSLDLSRHPELDSLQTFSIDVRVRPTQLNQRRNVIEAQTPGIALFIDQQGKVVGSIHTANGWESVNSGDYKVRLNRTAKIRLTRDDQGQTSLIVDGRKRGTKNIPGPITNVGDKGFIVGVGIDGRTYPFLGDISDLQIRDYVYSDSFVRRKKTQANTLKNQIVAATGIVNVKVGLLPDESYARLQPIKDIMNAVGVQKLDDLATLQLVTQTVMVPGKVILAHKKVEKVDWASVATKFIGSNVAEKKTLLATHLTNQNSIKTLRKIATVTPVTPIREISRVRRRIQPMMMPISRVGEVTALRIPVDYRVLRESPSVKLSAQPKSVFEVIKTEGSVTRIQDTELLTNLEQAKPLLWPVTSTQLAHHYTMNTIPVDSAVIIAGTLDLTNITLVIEPNVSTLYIIADKLICGPNANITWRRPDGTTPPRMDDLDLNGRGWSGVHPKDSRDGLDGEDGRPGGTGIDGADGHNAPNLEVWVKEITDMPNIDLNGEDGIKGGRGQRGGKGGNGADGHVGRRYWFFGWHCYKDPGDGGDGGDGGRGGRGGQGGNGGNGGNITIGVLEDTLEDTVTGRPFTIKNQGGAKGRGGDGGLGGAGGWGGRSGVGETCHDAENGHNGAQGQPGATGPDGSLKGIDGTLEFFEFTQEAWDDLLTRPWLSEVVPTHVFPGDTIILRGSRFTSNDTVVLGSYNLSPTVNADESISVTVPVNIGGGQKTLYVRRTDGTESNRILLYVKPQLNPISSPLVLGTEVTLTGRAFLSGASVLINSVANPSTSVTRTQIKFMMPGTGGMGSSGGTVSVEVRNPDGLVSNSRTAQIPRILEVPFQFGVHNLTFSNFDDGIPSWDTYEDTFGAAEVWHELLDPIFGHPILTAAFYIFYDYFLKGEANGGLATGFCTSMASLVADKFWKGDTDTHTIQKSDVHKMLTAIHGKLLSRESLIHFHDQSQEEITRVEKTYREIEATFLRGCDRHNAPLLFFIPSGAIWDSGYIDDLGDAHCVFPYRFMYPVGHPGPQLSADLTTTTTDPDQVELYVWDCNKPTSQNCKLVFRRTGSRIEFEYYPDSSNCKFSSQDNMTLGMMTNGAYYLADHDLPFSGPFGLTSFIIDFLLSPADLQVTDENGLRTGNFGGQILSEIPDSHPCYLVKGAYLLPEDTAFTRKIIGNRTGKYTFTSIMPNGLSFKLEDIDTQPGHEDVLITNADGSQIRFTPNVNKTFNLTIAKRVEGVTRAVSIEGIGGGPTADIDITLSPELSLLRVGNQGPARNVTVKAFILDEDTGATDNKEFTNIAVPTGHDLTVAAADWQTLDLKIEAIAFD